MTPRNYSILAFLGLAVALAFLAKNRPAACPPLVGFAEAPAAAARPAPSPSGLPRLVDLGAGKCVPCRMMAPILEDLKKSLEGRLEVQFIDVWERREAAASYGVRVIPTQIFYDRSGKELWRHEGFFSKEDILAKWKELGFAFGEEGPPRR